jgi:hypothetical protein
MCFDISANTISPGYMASRRQWPTGDEKGGVIRSVKIGLKIDVILIEI